MTSTPDSTILDIPFSYPVLAIGRGQRNTSKGPLVDSFPIRAPSFSSKDLETACRVRITDFDEHPVLRNGVLSFKNVPERDLEIRYVLIGGSLYRPVHAGTDLSSKGEVDLNSLGKDERDAFVDFVETGHITTQTAQGILNIYRRTRGGSIPFIDNRGIYDKALSSFGDHSVADRVAYPRIVSNREERFRALARRSANYAFVDGILHVPTTGPAYTLKFDRNTPKSADSRYSFDASGKDVFRIDVPFEEAMAISNRSPLFGMQPVDLEEVEVSPDIDIWFEHLPGSPSLAPLKANIATLSDIRNTASDMASICNILSGEGLLALGGLMVKADQGVSDVTQYGEDVTVLSEACTDALQDMDYLTPFWKQVERDRLVSQLERTLVHCRRMAELIRYDLSLEDRLENPARALP
jgi:hypothetical protein